MCWKNKSKAALIKELVVTNDYDDLNNKPIVNQDLDAEGFTPTAGVYYRHTGASSTNHTFGTVYYCNDLGYLDALAGEYTVKELETKTSIINVSTALNTTIGEVTQVNGSQMSPQVSAANIVGTFLRGTNNVIGQVIEMVEHSSNFKVQTIIDLNETEIQKQLDGKMPCNKATSTTGEIETFADEAGNSGIVFKNTDSENQYLIKYFKEIDELHVQYRSSEGEYNSPLVISGRVVHIKDFTAEHECSLNTNYVNGGSVKMYVNGNVCVLKFYVQLKNLTETYQSYTIATLPDGFTSLYECYGTVVAQGDASPAPNQAYITRIVGNEVQLNTKGVMLNNGWVLGGLTFFKTH